MDKATVGNSQAAINLVTMLQREEYFTFSPKVMRVLSKYFQSTEAIMAISDKTTREAVLRMWHNHFIDRVSLLDVPELIETHTLCVGKTRYRQLITRRY